LLIKRRMISELRGKCFIGDWRIIFHEKKDNQYFWNWLIFITTRI
jgi:hypothetical protein